VLEAGGARSKKCQKQEVLEAGGARSSSPAGGPVLHRSRQRSSSSQRAGIAPRTPRSTSKPPLPHSLQPAPPLPTSCPCKTPLPHLAAHCMQARKLLPPLPVSLYHLQDSTRRTAKNGIIFRARTRASTSIMQCYYSSIFVFQEPETEARQYLCGGAI
jgi:hypothetical protein